MSSDRATQLRTQIALLQSQLDALPSTSTPSPTPSPTPRQPRAVGTPKKKLKKAIPTGPLPPALAAAPKRHIALLFSYEGWSYSGLAYQPSHQSTPLPTVEGTILDALVAARLIDGGIETDGFGCGFERCGRTDAGVSSSAQVINLWVRSELEDPMGAMSVPEEEREKYRGPRSSWSTVRSDATDSTSTSSPIPTRRKAYSKIELPYIQLLNRLLPSSIRILAWSPISPTFSSRYSCIWRHYKYFFSTTPTRLPQYDFGSVYSSLGLSSSEKEKKEKRLKEIWFGGMALDVGKMREAVEGVVGSHDFRNLCKVDPCKQLTSHVREVISASIDSVEGEGDDLFVLNLRGGAFLYNQVRNIMSLLFLIGASFEPPSTLSQLLWTADRTSTTIALHESSLPPSPIEMNSKPGFEMADDLPLVLWKCGYNSMELDWRLGNLTMRGDVAGLLEDGRERDKLERALSEVGVNGTTKTTTTTQSEDGSQSDSESESTSTTTMTDPQDDPGNGRLKFPILPSDSFRRQYLSMNESYQRLRIQSLILKHHLSAFASFVPPPPSPSTNSQSTAIDDASTPSSHFAIIPHGAGRSSITKSYIPLLSRPRTDLPEVANKRWAEGKGRGRMIKREEGREKSEAERKVNLRKKEEAREVAREVARREQDGKLVSE